MAGQIRGKTGAGILGMPGAYSGLLAPLQVRTRVLNEDWRSTLSHWYPGMEETCDAKAA